MARLVAWQAYLFVYHRGHRGTEIANPKLCVSAPEGCLLCGKQKLAPNHHLVLFIAYGAVKTLL
jgi:hypothetical protein